MSAAHLARLVTVYWSLITDNCKKTEVTTPLPSLSILILFAALEVTNRNKGYPGYYVL